MQTIEQERHSRLKLTVIIGYLLLYVLLNLVGDTGGPLPFNLDNPGTVMIIKILQAITVIVIFILPALLFAKYWTSGGWTYLGLTTRPGFATMLFAGIGMLAAMPLINWLGVMNSNMDLPDSLSGIENWMRASEDRATILTEAFLRGETIGVLLLNLFVIAFMAAISEELFFRGVLQKVLLGSRMNKHLAIWIGAVIFSAFHMQFYGFVPRMLMGAYLGYLFLWTGSIWPGILAHFLTMGWRCTSFGW
ncbi:MAG: CPBP family intramembrane metalloprotease [Bacteroidota bacterium]|nr:CPBP family intramembrane metalloprotease [Bacteroidota bacterium]